MRQAIIKKFGPANEVFSIIEKPDINSIADDDILVEGLYTTVNPIDTKIRKGDLKIISGSKFPRVLGREYSGIIRRIGKNIQQFKIGDSVIGFSKKEGGYSTQNIFKESELVHLLDEVSFEDGASIPNAALTAYNGLFELGNLKPGMDVLIIGVTGAVGHIAAQLSKIYKTNVTGVYGKKNLSKVVSLNLNKIIDYTSEKYYLSDDKYDIVYDTVSALNWKQGKKILKSKGIYINTLPSPGIILHQLFINHFSQKKIKFIMNHFNKKAIKIILELIKKRELSIWKDSEYILDDIVLAHQRSESNHAVGKIVLKLT